MTIEISVFNNARDTYVKTATLSLPEFINKLIGQPEYVECSGADDKFAKEAGEMWSPALYTGPTRDQSKVTKVSCLPLDFDRGLDGQPGVPIEEEDSLFKWLDEHDYLYAGHTSFTSGYYSPRRKFRLVLFFSSPVKPEQWNNTWKVLYEVLPIKPDKARNTFSGNFFSPRCPLGHEHLYESFSGGSKFFEPEPELNLNLAQFRKPPTDWLKALREAPDGSKHTTLVAAAFALGAAQGRRGSPGNEAAVWLSCRAALESNPTPPKDWAAAERTCLKQARAGWDKAEKPEAPAEEVSPALAKRGHAKLAGAVKVLRKDVSNLFALSAGVGGFVPHVINFEYASKVLFEAVLDSKGGTEKPGELDRAGNFVEAETHRLTIERGLAVGGKNPVGLKAENWRKILGCDPENGKIINNDANVKKLVEHMWSHNLRYNVRSLTVEWGEAPPWRDTAGPLQDQDGWAAAAWAYDVVETTLGSAAQFSRALDALAYTNDFDPFKTWLDELKWDEEPRLDSWLTQSVQAEADDYTKYVGAKWLLQAVKRTYEPGCQADYVLVLSGKQGVGKSSAFRILGGPYFSDCIGPLEATNPTTVQNLEKYVIVELSELTAYKKSEVTAFKYFMTSTSASVRPAYARFTREFKRRGVFGGSTNEDQFLRDPTGDRRYWVVRSGLLDRAWLEGSRDQLWAEAVHRYKAGELTYPSEAESRMIREHTQEHVETDWGMDDLDFFGQPYSGVGVVLEGADQVVDGKFVWVSLKQIYEKLGLDIKDRGTQNRVSDAITRRGWKKASKKIDGIKKKVVLL